MKSSRQKRSMSTIQWESSERTCTERKHPKRSSRDASVSARSLESVALRFRLERDLASADVEARW